MCHSFILSEKNLFCTDTIHFILIDFLESPIHIKVRKFAFTFRLFIRIYSVHSVKYAFGETKPLSISFVYAPYRAIIKSIGNNVYRLAIRNRSFFYSVEARRDIIIIEPSCEFRILS